MALTLAKGYTETDIVPMRVNPAPAAEPDPSQSEG